MSCAPPRWLPAIPVLAAVTLGVSLWRDGGAAARSGASEADGSVLYFRQCAACHGAAGEGVDDRGPSLVHEGRAAVDFVLRTGRMPLPDPDRQPVRRRVVYSEQEIVALVDFVGALGDGPDIPDVDPDRGDLVNGGRLYRLNCAACHVASGAGAAIGGGRLAPSLMDATSTQVGEAVLVGPGAMPVFGSLTGADLDDLAAYVRQLQEDDATGADSLGGVGPVAEGLAAWVLGLLALVGVSRWIGRPADADEGDIADAAGRGAR